MKTIYGFLLGFSLAAVAAQDVTPKAPTFKAVEIDSKIEIGYGVTVADINGDKKPDIILADKNQIVWYQNPTWEKHIIAEKLTKLDHVCIAARDIDGDGKAELAAGAGWNPSDTANSGAVFYLVAPADRTQKWEPVELPHEPTVHRMRWVKTADGKFNLVVCRCTGAATIQGPARVTAPRSWLIKCLRIPKAGGRRKCWTPQCTRPTTSIQCHGIMTVPRRY